MPKKNSDEPKRKPGPKRIEIDYDAVEIFCRSQISDAQLARKLRVSPQVLSMRLKKDPQLREAREGGRYDGQSMLHEAIFRKAFDRYMTICKDCGKHRISFEGFLESCPYCDKLEPDESPHTNVKHKFIPGDTSVLIHLSKNYLGMSDKVTHKGDEGSPVVFATLADLAVAAAERKRVKDAQNQEDPPKKE